jgi:hypothetical protein
MNYKMRILLSCGVYTKEQQLKQRQLNQRINREMSSGKRKTHLLCLFYYKFKINKHFFGANQLSKFLDIGLYSAQYITKFIKSSSYLAIVYKKL